MKITANGMDITRDEIERAGWALLNVAKSIERAEVQQAQVDILGILYGQRYERETREAAAARQRVTEAVERWNCIVAGFARHPKSPLFDAACLETMWARMSGPQP